MSSSNCMLAHVYNPKRVIFPAYTQPKLNGVRAILSLDKHHCWKFISRQGNELFLPHITQNIRSSDVLSLHTALDGEIYAHGQSFDYISGLARTKSDTLEKNILAYHVYDSIMPYPFTQRLQYIWCSGNNMFPVETKKVKTVAEIEANHRIYLGNGYEGTMIRNNGEGYEMKRSFNLLKLKSWLYKTCVVVGVIEGKGEYKGMLGAFTVRDEEGRIFKLSGKLTREARKEFILFPPIGKILVVKYRELNENGMPVPATFQKWGEDR